MEITSLFDRNLKTGPGLGENCFTLDIKVTGQNQATGLRERKTSYPRLLGMVFGGCQVNSNFVMV